MNESAPLLAVTNLEAWYGRSHILQGVDIQVNQGEIVCLIGRNGAGKTTLMRSIMGLMDRARGSVVFDGLSLLGLPPHRRFRHGLAYVFEERRIVPGLTVLENIRLGILASEQRHRERELIDEVAETFPRLKERLSQVAVTMSGGEQQMLAIARAMVAHPKLIMLDEPSEGIMPVLVDEMFELFESLKRAGKTLLLVEQNVELALSVADRAYVVDQGRIVHHAAAAALLADQAIQERYCSV
jgi:branched-chain amino acid transport system ATP-binding protein